MSMDGLFIDDSGDDILPCVWCGGDVKLSEGRYDGQGRLYHKKCFGEAMAEHTQENSGQGEYT